MSPVVGELNTSPIVPDPTTEKGNYSVAQSVRRPTLFRYNDQIRDYVESLSTSPGATIHDKRLVAWAQLMQIVESFARDLSYEDLSNIASVDDPQTHALFRIYEERLAGWRLNFDTTVFNGLRSHLSFIFHYNMLTLTKGSLELSYHHMAIYLHEIALHHDRNPEDFKPPFTFKNLYNNKRSSRASPCINIILRCVSSVQALIECFLHMDIDSVRTLPLFGFIRFAYGIIILEMIASPSGNTPYEYGVFLNRDSLQIDYYSSLVINHLQHVTETAQCRVPSFFLGMMLKLRSWHQRRSQIAAPLNSAGQVAGSQDSSSGTPATMHTTPQASDQSSAFSEVSYTGIYDDDETGLPTASTAFAPLPPLNPSGGNGFLAAWALASSADGSTRAQSESVTPDLGLLGQHLPQETDWMQVSQEPPIGLEDEMLLDFGSWGGDNFGSGATGFAAPVVTNDFGGQTFAWN